jgi:hypothetical protein
MTSRRNLWNCKDNFGQGNFSGNLCLQFLNHSSMVCPPPSIRKAAVAQLDRAPDYGSGGSGFEPLRLHHSLKSPARGFLIQAKILGFYEKYILWH